VSRAAANAKTDGRGVSSFLFRARVYELRDFAIELLTLSGNRLNLHPAVAKVSKTREMLLMSETPHFYFHFRRRCVSRIYFGRLPTITTHFSQIARKQKARFKVKSTFAQESYLSALIAAPSLFCAPLPIHDPPVTPEQRFSRAAICRILRQIRITHVDFKRA